MQQPLVRSPAGAAARGGSGWRGGVAFRGGLSPRTPGVGVLESVTEPRNGN